MTTEAKSTKIEKELKAVEDSLNAGVEITQSAFEVIEEMKEIDGNRKGNELLLSESEKISQVSQWEIYRQALTDGLENDESYQISNDEIDDLYIMLGKADYSKATRILDEYSEGVLA